MVISTNFFHVIDYFCDFHPFFDRTKHFDKKRPSKRDTPWRNWGDHFKSMDFFRRKQDETNMCQAQRNKHAAEIINPLN